ncbi:MAG: hypothetical protein HYW08_11885 [candidate division NC10 bacterium]|nr:hypothetical protein [Candidatus Rokubacteria bacterium]MBI2563063.1 hypothetical protein [candidate division NC10 bacterium]
MSDDLLTTLESALALGDTMIIVRSGAAIAEVAAGPLRRGKEWLTLGDEGAGASHVHVKISDVRGLRYGEQAGRNAALDVLGADGTVIVSLSFRGTNPAQTERFAPDRLAAVRASLGHLAEVPA